MIFMSIFCNFFAEINNKSIKLRRNLKNKNLNGEIKDKDSLTTTKVSPHTNATIRSAASLSFMVYIGNVYKNVSGCIGSIVNNQRSEGTDKK